MSTANPPPAICCPHCQAQLKAVALPSGTPVKCPTCGQTFTYTAPGAAPNPQSANRNPQAPPTVDPLMLGPVAQPAAAKSTDIAIVCRLCGTRMYAPAAKIGGTMPCPDCHTVNEIKPPREAAPKRAGPSLEGAEEYDLSDPGERPTYRPLVAARGDYAELAQFEPGAHPPGWSEPHPSDAVGPPKDSADDELKLAAPVERIETKVSFPLPPPGAALVDGPGSKQPDDRLLGYGVDLKQPGAWKRAPFLLGLVGFLTYASTLVRLFSYAIGLALAAFLTRLAIESAAASSSFGQLSAVIWSMTAAIWWGLWLAPFSSCLLAIVQDTANGQDEVTGWPDWNAFDWIGSALYFPAAGFLAGLPGALVASGLVAGGMPPIAAPLLVLVSWVVLFPLVIYSMLAEASLLTPFSSRTSRSLKIAGDAWMLFYVYSIAIGLVVAVSYGLASLDYVAAQAGGAVGVVTAAFIYCRVLGRLLWFTSEEDARLDSANAAGNPPA
jgi:hypothetical protein